MMQHPTGAYVAIFSGVIAFAEGMADGDISTRAVAITGVIGGLLTGGFQYYKYWLDQKQLATKAAEANAAATAALDRANKLEADLKAKDAKIDQLRDEMLRAAKAAADAAKAQLDDYKEYRHKGPDAAVNRQLLANSAQTEDNTRAINGVIPVIKANADRLGVPAVLPAPVESIVAETKADGEPPP